MMKEAKLTLMEKISFWIWVKSCGAKSGKISIIEKGDRLYKKIEKHNKLNNENNN